MRAHRTFGQWRAYTPRAAWLHREHEIGFVLLAFAVLATLAAAVSTCAL